MKSIVGMTIIIVIILLTYGMSGYSGYCLGLGRSRNDLNRGRFGGEGIARGGGEGEGGVGRGIGGGRGGGQNIRRFSFRSSGGSGGGGRRHLHLEGVEVPVYKFRGEDAQLECKYDPGTDPLYSVKWYKDDHEFYRYLFGKQPPKQTFPIPGILVDVHRSNERRVLLKQLTFNSTGVYRCEVSADSPHFRTYDNHSTMVVVELPERDPTISGGRSHYRVGDTASLNCTSSKSMPAASLTWLINDTPVVERSQLVNYYPWKHDDGLESRRLGLSFTVTKSHFLKGELTLKCQATVAAIYSAVEEEDATVSEGEPYILHQRENLILVRSGCSADRYSIYSLLLPFLLLLLREQPIT